MRGWRPYTAHMQFTGTNICRGSSQLEQETSWMSSMYNWLQSKPYLSGNSIKMLYKAQKHQKYGSKDQISDLNVN